MWGQGYRRERRYRIRHKGSRRFLPAILALWVVASWSLLTSSIIAQNTRPEQVAATVYQQLSYLPQANQYRRQEDREIDPNNTLISRVIRYHQDVKKRPTPYRLDWQLTMADYLGANENMLSERYPGVGLLTENPMEADIQLMRQLSRTQRIQLIDVLVSIYSPSAPQANPSPNPAPSPSVAPKPTPLQPSRPGDADLLKF